MDVTQFYAGVKKDHMGRTLQEIQRFPFDDLEDCHDYIQWMFPLPEPSNYNPFCPLIEEQDIFEFKNNPFLKQRLLESLDVMLEFYGFVRSHGIATGVNFRQRCKNWVTPYNHNFLRLTRIIRSLHVLGCQNEAKDLQKVLEYVYNIPGNAKIIGEETLSYWRAATCS